MSTHGDGGKGSSRRVENTQAVRDGWDRIFGAKGVKAVSQEIKEHEMIYDEHENEHFEEDHEDETDVNECPVCRGHLCVTGTGMYLFCDTCGHREELDHDYDD